MRDCETTGERTGLAVLRGCSALTASPTNRLTGRHNLLVLQICEQMCEDAHKNARVFEDQPTYPPTDTTAFRVAGPRLKIKE